MPPGLHTIRRTKNGILSRRWVLPPIRSIRWFVALLPRPATSAKNPPKPPLNWILKEENNVLGIYVHTRRECTLRWAIWRRETELVEEGRNRKEKGSADESKIRKMENKREKNCKNIKTFWIRLLPNGLVHLWCPKLSAFNTSVGHRFLRLKKRTVEPMFLTPPRSQIGRHPWETHAYRPRRPNRETHQPSITMVWIVLVVPRPTIDNRQRIRWCKPEPENAIQPCSCS